MHTSGNHRRGKFLHLPGTAARGWGVTSPGLNRRQPLDPHPHPTHNTQQETETHRDFRYHPHPHLDRRHRRRHLPGRRPVNPLLAVTIAAIIAFIIGGVGMSYIDQRVRDEAVTRPQYALYQKERQRWAMLAAAGWYTAIFGIVIGIFRALAA